jgi:hypothetical protein
MIRLQQQLLLSGCAGWAAAQDVECPEDSKRQPAPAATLIWPDVEGDTRTCGDLTVVLPYFSPDVQAGTSQPRECQTSDCDYSGCDQPDSCSIDISGSWCFDRGYERGYEHVIVPRCGGCGIMCYVHIMQTCCGGMNDGWSAWGDPSDGCGSYNKDGPCDNTTIPFLIAIVIVCVCLCIVLRKHYIAKRPVETASVGPTDSATTMQSPFERLNNRCSEPWKAGHRPDWPCWKMVLFIVLCAGLIVAIGFGLLMLLMVAAYASGGGPHGRPFIVDGRALVAEATDGGSSDWWTPAGEL